MVLTQQSCKLQAASYIRLKYTRSEAFSTRGQIKNQNTVHSALILIAENCITNRKSLVVAGNPEITPQLILRRRLMLRFFPMIASTATPKSRFQHNSENDPCPTAVTAGAEYVGSSIHGCTRHPYCFMLVNTSTR